MNHTHGPWIEDEHITSDSEGEITIVIFCPDGPGYGRVAQVYAECGRNTELKPNAHLIAAAPELLEALQIITSGTIEIEPNYVHSKLTTTGMKRIAQEAIAKAKGE